MGAFAAPLPQRATIAPPRSLARPLPRDCVLRRAAAGDAERVAGLLRAEDRAEMEALEGRSALAVLQGWMTGPSRVLAIRGEAIAIYGVVPCLMPWSDPGSQKTGAATPWIALSSTLDAEDERDVMWLSRFQIDAWQRRWPHLLAVCDVRNLFHQHWLGWLGFEKSGSVASYGAMGLPFDLHVRLRHQPICRERTLQ